MTSAVAPTPVFVLGLQRSGTTWLANLMAAHPEVAAVAAPEHRGVHESVFFSHFARLFGAWEDQAARRRFLEAFLASDYFRLTGLDPVWAAGLAVSSYGAFFRAVMDAFAAREGCRVWLEKSPHHTLLAEWIAREVHGAVFVAVVRAPLDLLRSRLWAYGRTPPAYPRRAFIILRATASILFHRRALERLASRRPDTLLISFEALARDPAAALAPVAVKLRIAPFDGVRSAYAANSSFADGARRARALGVVDTFLARAALAVVAAVPQALLLRLQRRIARARPDPLPAWTYRFAGEPR